MNKAVNLNKNLEQLRQIAEWFDNQEAVDVEEGLIKVKEASILIKESKVRLQEIENSFEEIQSDLKDDNTKEVVEAEISQDQDIIDIHVSSRVTLEKDDLPF